MPRSKSKRRRYQPPSRKKRKPSPKWFGALVLILLFGGVAVVVANYMGVIPGTGKNATNLYLFLGLGLIAGGFMAATQWR